MHLAGYLHRCTKMMQGHTNIKLHDIFPFCRNKILKTTVEYTM